MHYPCRHHVFSTVQTMSDDALKVALNEDHNLRCSRSPRSCMETAWRFNMIQWESSSDAFVTGSAEDLYKCALPFDRQQELVMASFIVKGQVNELWKRLEFFQGDFGWLSHIFSKNMFSFFFSLFCSFWFETVWDAESIWKPGLKTQDYGKWGPWLGNAFASCPGLRGQWLLTDIGFASIFRVGSGCYHFIVYNHPGVWHENLPYHSVNSLGRSSVHPRVPHE